MDRASVTFGTPDSRAGSMDGFALGTHEVGEGSGQSPSPDADQIGKALSRREAVLAPQGEQKEDQERVTPGQLWFDLPLDQRTRFGDCFSRMLLKCLDGIEKAEQEVQR